MPPPWAVGASLVILASSLTPLPGVDDLKLKFTDCPPAVRKTFQAEAPDAKFESVTRERDDENETIFWADAAIGDKTYSIGVLEDGTLSEVDLAFDDEEIPLDQCPEVVRETFKLEGFGEKVEQVGKHMKYGITLYDATVKHKEKAYEISVAEDGTLVEKVLVIDDEEIELAKCPPPVQASFKKLANGGVIHDVTRSTGIIRNTFEATIEIRTKVYVVEVDDAGILISKALEAGEE